MSESVAENRCCMEAMAGMPDKAFDLAIVDPPYGIGLAANPIRQMHAVKSWDKEIPTKEYFNELRRVSADQIIWGGNFFPLPPTQNLIVWDKKQPFDFSLAMCEMAWCSIQRPSKIFRFAPMGGDKIHPTQKPVALYKWLLTNYAKPGDRVLDTHLGSGSSRIAAYDLGFDFYGTELDADYFEAQERQFAAHVAQPKLWEPRPATMEQGSLIEPRPGDGDL